MDPQACFDEWLSLWQDTGGIMTGAQSERVDDLTEAYEEWTGRGGFLAVTPDGDDVADLSSSGQVKVATLLGSQWIGWEQL